MSQWQMRNWQKTLSFMNNVLDGIFFFFSNWKCFSWKRMTGRNALSMWSVQGNKIEEYSKNIHLKYRTIEIRWQRWRFLSKKKNCVSIGFLTYGYCRWLCVLESCDVMTMIVIVPLFDEKKTQFFCCCLTITIDQNHW